jgi:hypothetical protein
MNDVASRGQFLNLIEAVAERARSDSVTASEASGISELGPSVGDDNLPPVVTALGPSVGDDTPQSPRTPRLTELGPSIGDDDSDVRLKHDVHCVGTTVFGLPLYRFKYIGRPETYEGVMAHDVLQVMPSAVSVGADGYHRVNYSALGTRMRQVS